MQKLKKLSSLAGLFILRNLRCLTKFLSTLQTLILIKFKFLMKITFTKLFVDQTNLEIV